MEKETQILDFTYSIKHYKDRFPINGSIDFGIGMLDNSKLLKSPLSFKKLFNLL